ncbi:ABC transporter permease [Anaerosporobacter sp.]
MGTYLVIKNNMKRAMRKRGNIAMVVIIPFLICVLTVISLQFKNNIVRVGILVGEDTMEKDIEDVMEQLKGYEGIEVQRAESTLVNTNLITGRYHRYIDMEKPLEPQIQKIKTSTAISENVLNVKSSSKEAKQAVGLLITTFLVLATVHAVEYIKDQKNGVISRYIMSGHVKGSYFMGYCGYTFLITAFQCGVCLGLIQAIMPKVRMEFSMYITIVLSIALLAAVLAMCIVKLSKSDLRANLTASSSAIILSLLAGTFVETGHMPKIMQTLQVINPISWILKLLT